MYKTFLKILYSEVPLKRPACVAK